MLKYIFNVISAPLLNNISNIKIGKRKIYLFIFKDESKNKEKKTLNNCNTVIHKVIKSVLQSIAPNKKRIGNKNNHKSFMFKNNLNTFLQTVNNT